MNCKEFVLKAVKRMPAVASFQEILFELDELCLVESIRRRMNKKTKGVPAEEVPKLIENWIREVESKTSVRK